jgi:hypothetical protein
MNKEYYQSFLNKEFRPSGLPSNYPIPEREGMLFYIQRNLNVDTVVYQINTNVMGDIIHDHPMKVYWIKYDRTMRECDLNIIQDKLAYGYESFEINNELFEFKFVCNCKRFFIKRFEDGSYKVLTKINEDYHILKKIYVYAEEFGAFPDVQFVELHGIHIENNSAVYEKLVF